VDLNRPMSEIRETLSKYPIKTRVSLSGPVVVARDIAHAKLKERIDTGKGLPDYIKNHIIYYAGPAKTPDGYVSGSFGPTTAGRMDSYVDLFMANGGSFVTLAKGNRSRQVSKACEKHKGFYLGSIGGPAAILAKNCIKKVGWLVLSISACMRARACVGTIDSCNVQLIISSCIRSRYWNTQSLEWRRSGRLRWRISQPSSLSMIREMTSSRS
jgi:tartrate/fumarate subfamily iron-sulfur-dependent hydro-lyase beta chain